MNIFICGIDDMRQFHGKATHVLSVIEPDDARFLQELGVPIERRLILYCDDVDSRQEAKAREREMPGSRCIAPTRAIVKKALDFGRNLTAHDSLLVHCGYGVSRSTAMAFAILCQDNPQTPEIEVLNQVVKIRPVASPNALIVKHADALLNRQGRMNEALQAHLQKQ
jgi:predicted protein tyrosine phosphatase